MGEAPARVTAMELDAGCRQNMLWRCDGAPELIVPLVERLCETEGFANSARSIVGLLYLLDHPDGHQLVLVPRTGRIQIRLDAFTPPPERPATATALHAALARAALDAT